MNCYSSIMAADSTSDNAAEMSICSKVDHFYTCGWNSMVLGNETEFAHPHCSVFLENQTDSGSVEIMPKVTVTSNGYMDESGCQSDAKRKRNASSSKNGNGNSSSKQTVDIDEDVVHLRAKRGQATSSHSLAERMRRERISERMKLLQDLVPGCDKITGKAVVLDEIISYVQSLQQQVEFLSMKLANVNPELSMDIEKILSKDLLYPRGSHGVSWETSQGNIPGGAPRLPQSLWNNELQNILRGSYGEDE